MTKDNDNWSTLKHLQNKGWKSDRKIHTFKYQGTSDEDEADERIDKTRKLYNVTKHSSSVKKKCQKK